MFRFFRNRRNRQMAHAISSQYLWDLTNKIIPDLCETESIDLPQGKKQPEGFWTHEYTVGFYTMFISQFIRILLGIDMMDAKTYKDKLHPEDKHEIFTLIFDEICPHEKEVFMTAMLKQLDEYKATGFASDDFELALNNVTTICIFQEGRVDDVKEELMDSEEILEAKKIAKNQDTGIFHTTNKLNFNQKVASCLTLIYLTRHLRDHFQ